MKRVFIKTYGCQMNERDSESVAALLRQRGYQVIDSETDADVVLLNTCSVRDQAEQKAVGKMGMLARGKRGRPGLVLGYLGCMAQSRGAALADDQPAVDLVVGTQRIHHVPEYLDRLLARQENCRASAPLAIPAPVAGGAPALQHRIVDIAEEPGSESAVRDHLPVAIGDRPVTAFVSIQQGCDMHCAFCIVPHTRGAERSRSIPEIVDEVRALTGQGVKEVTLLGQIVTSYGRKRGRADGWKNGSVEGCDASNHPIIHSSSLSAPQSSNHPSMFSAPLPSILPTFQTSVLSCTSSPFVCLLEAVHEVPGLERIRFTSPHPKGFRDDLAAAYRDLPKLCEHAHLPVQSGSDRILRQMKRGYTRDGYRRIVDKLRAAQPAIALSTDVIVGFPGETEDDFGQTAALIREVGFDQAFVFKYSPRRDTPAAAMPNPVGAETLRERNRLLLDIVNESALRRNTPLVGSVVEILVEGRSEKGGRRMMGRTRTNKIVVYDGPESDQGRLLGVRVERANSVTLYGQTVIDEK